jgi:hypothetical protein
MAMSGGDDRGYDGSFYKFAGDAARDSAEEIVPLLLAISAADEARPDETGCSGDDAFRHPVRLPGPRTGPADGRSPPKPAEGQLAR